MLSIESKFFSLGLTIGVADEQRKGKIDVHEQKFSCLGRNPCDYSNVKKKTDEKLNKRLTDFRNIITSGSIERIARICFARVHLPWKKSKEIITITSIREGTFRELDDNEHERRRRTRHPSWIAFNPIREKRVTNGLGYNKRRERVLERKNVANVVSFFLFLIPFLSKPRKKYLIKTSVIFVEDILYTYRHISHIKGENEIFGIVMF